jgi:hypothetical protein
MYSLSLIHTKILLLRRKRRGTNPYYRLEVNAVMLLVKLPVPVPSAVFELVIVGVAAVPQQTPLAVTLAPPSEVTFPPAVAVLVVIAEAAVVVNVGTLELFVQPLINANPRNKQIITKRPFPFFIVIFINV